MARTTCKVIALLGECTVAIPDGLDTGLVQLEDIKPKPWQHQSHFVKFNSNSGALPWQRWTDIPNHSTKQRKLKNKISNLKQVQMKTTTNNNNSSPANTVYLMMPTPRPTTWTGCPTARVVGLELGSFCQTVRWRARDNGAAIETAFSFSQLHLPKVLQQTWYRLSPLLAALGLWIGTWQFLDPRMAILITPKDAMKSLSLSFSSVLFDVLGFWAFWRMCRARSNSTRHALTTSSAKYLASCSFRHYT